MNELRRELEVSKYVKLAVRERLNWIKGEEASSCVTLEALEGRLRDTKAKLCALEVEKFELAHFLAETGEGSVGEVSAEGWKVYK